MTETRIYLSKSFTIWNWVKGVFMSWISIITKVLLWRNICSIIIPTKALTVMKYACSKGSVSFPTVSWLFGSRFKSLSVNVVDWRTSGSVAWLQNSSEQAPSHGTSGIQTYEEVYCQRLRHCWEWCVGAILGKEPVPFIIVSNLIWNRLKTWLKFIFLTLYCICAVSQ